MLVSRVFAVTVCAHVTTLLHITPLLYCSNGCYALSCQFQASLCFASGPEPGLIADFTNRVEDMRLQDLAEGDSKELVSQVHLLGLVRIWPHRSA